MGDESPRLFLGNFDFEAGLVSPSTSSSRDAIRRNSELALAWLGIARAGDVIVAEHLPDAAFCASLDRLNRRGVRFARSTDSFGDGFVVTPWGWERRVFVWADSVGLEEVAPPLHAIAAANSREFSFACERDFGCGLEGQAVCCTVEEVNAAVSSLERWLIKANFGAAGRERLTGRGRPGDDACRWLVRRLERDGAVFVEPFVEAVEEAGVQWAVPQGGGEPELVGIVPLLSDERGQYRGSVVASDPALEQWRSVVEVSRRAADRAQKLGYFGPIGIDAMRYRDSYGTIRDRPLQDINARWTMGRLALGWRDFVAEENGAAVFRAGPESEMPMGSNVVRISAEMLGGERVRHRFWLEWPGE